MLKTCVKLEGEWRIELLALSESPMTLTLTSEDTGTCCRWMSALTRWSRSFDDFGAGQGRRIVPNGCLQLTMLK
jgi:hypothetical protein